jgi:hypothetical protein
VGKAVPVSADTIIEIVVFPVGDIVVIQASTEEIAGSNNKSTPRVALASEFVDHVGASGEVVLFHGVSFLADGLSVLSL